MRLPKFEYIEPDTLEDAISVLTDKGEDASIMAGGTDLVIKMKKGLLRPGNVVCLRKIKGLNKIDLIPRKGLSIGSTALIVEVATHPGIIKKYPAIAYAAGIMANVQVRNMGTVAGNICNAAPSADNAPPLMAMGAEAVLAGPDGERRLTMEEFFKGPGITAIKTGELMTSIFVPLPPKNSGVSYKRVSARGKVDIASVSSGAMVVMDGEKCKDVKIVLGAVAPVPLRSVKAEDALKGKKLTQNLIKKAGDLASDESRPITDVRASSEYRKKMVNVLTVRALEEAWARAKKR